MKNTGVFILAAVFFVAASVWATTIGTNIDSTGTIGVATSTPWGDLAVEQVAGNTKLHPVFVVGDSGTTSPFLFVSQKGNIGIGTSTPNKVLNIPLTGTTLLLGASNGGATSRIVLESLDPNINLADSNGTAGQRVGAIKQDSNVMSFFGVSDAGSVNTNAYLRFKVSDGNFEVGDGGALFDGELSVYQTGSGDIFNLYDSSSLVFTILDGGSVGVGNTTTPALTGTGDTSFGGDGVTSDVYISGGLGIGNATTADSNFIVGGAGLFPSSFLSYTSNGRLIVGATTTAQTTSNITSKFIFDGGDASFSSGGTGTTTFGIYNEAAANGANACIEMSTDGIVYRVFINAARTGLSVEAGTCKNN